MVFLDGIRLTDAELAAMAIWGQSQVVRSERESQTRYRALSRKQKTGRRKNKAARRARKANRK